jgi:hypothetical protein
MAIPHGLLPVMLKVAPGEPVGLCLRAAALRLLGSVFPALGRKRKTPRCVRGAQNLF